MYRLRAATLSPMNQAAASDRKPSTASPATWTPRTVSSAYPSAALRAAALATAAGIDTRLGSRDATR